MLNIVALIRSYIATHESERGAVLAEYALLLALIAVLVVGAIALLRTGIINAITAAAGVLG